MAVLQGRSRQGPQQRRLADDISTSGTRTSAMSPSTSPREIEKRRYLKEHNLEEFVQAHAKTRRQASRIRRRVDLVT